MKFGGKSGASDFIPVGMAFQLDALGDGYVGMYMCSSRQMSLG